MLGGLILAAGRGSRMKHHADDKPKSLVMYQGKTLFQRILDNFIENAISDIAIVRGYQKNLLSAPCITHYFENTRWQETNILRSLLSADIFLTNHDTIISYADIFYDPEAIHLLKQSTNGFAITSNSDFLSSWQARFENIYDDIESFTINNHANLVEIGKRVTDLRYVQGQFMGLFKITSSMWQEVKIILAALPDAQMDKMDITTFLSLLIKHGIAIKVIAYQGSWGEIDSPEDLALYTS